MNPFMYSPSNVQYYDLSIKNYLFIKKYKELLILFLDFPFPKLILYYFQGMYDTIL